MFTTKFDIPFQEKEWAEIVGQVLDVDKERGEIHKEIRIESNHLIITVQSENLKLLRSVVSSLLEMVELSTKTILECRDL